MDNTFSSYLFVNRERYNVLTKELLAEIQKCSNSVPSVELIKARRDFLDMAIAKGIDFSEFSFKDISFLNAEGLADVAHHLSDKDAFDKKDREQFALAAQRRARPRRWDNLFSTDNPFLMRADDVVSPFVGAVDGTQDKIVHYIDSYNAQNSRKIRLNPDDPLKLQELGEKDKWVPGMKLCKFLQRQREWELFEIVQREEDRRQKGLRSTQQKKKLSADASLKDIANRAGVDHVDTFMAAENLRVFISRDPQKIGEMSTGQRWRSCMTKEGVNYQYVPRDIEAGTLVAYVVHKDDVDARYPIMRALIKPYVNASGETVLVPASKIYGSYLNATKTIDSFKETLATFVRPQNEGKEGSFALDERLYADGEAGVVRISGEAWVPSEVQEAIHVYQRGALQEWVAELGISNGAAEREDTEEQRKSAELLSDKLRKKIRHSFDMDDEENGLPRQFFLQTMKSSLNGNLPRPQSVIDAIKTDVPLQNQKAVLSTILNQDHKQWGRLLSLMSFGERAQTAIKIGLSMKPGSKEEGFVVEKICKDRDYAIPFGAQFGYGIRKCAQFYRRVEQTYWETIRENAIKNGVIGAEEKLPVFDDPLFSTAVLPKEEIMSVFLERIKENPTPKALGMAMDFLEESGDSGVRQRAQNVLIDYLRQDTHPEEGGIHEKNNVFGAVLRHMTDFPHNMSVEACESILKIAEGKPAKEKFDIARRVADVAASLENPLLCSKAKEIALNLSDELLITDIAFDLTKIVFFSDRFEGALGGVQERAGMRVLDYLEQADAHAAFFLDDDINEFGIFEREKMLIRPHYEGFVGEILDEQLSNFKNKSPVLLARVGGMFLDAISGMPLDEGSRDRVSDLANVFSEKTAIGKRARVALSSGEGASKPIMEMSSALPCFSK